MQLKFPRRVREEAREAIDYYEAERPGLGDHLWQELQISIRWISSNPTVPRLRPGDYRRVNLHAFPYYIAYAIRGEFVVLLAIGHAARRPEYWMVP